MARNNEKLNRMEFSTFMELTSTAPPLYLEVRGFLYAAVLYYTKALK